MAETAYIGLGSNMGDRLATLQSALAHLCGFETVTVAAASGAWERPVSKHWFGTFFDQN